MWWLWEQLHLLEPSSQLGGIYADKPGYHNTRAANSPSNYSVVDAEDRGGPSDKAAAIDWTFPEAQSGSYDRIIKYSNRLLVSARDLNDDRLNGWREFYGQADKDTQVEGWDFRYYRPATSEPSHLWHIHLSEDRNKVEDYDNKRMLLSVLRGEEMAIDLDQDVSYWYDKFRLFGIQRMLDPITIPKHTPTNTPATTEPNLLAQAIRALDAKLDQIINQGVQVEVDELAIAAAVADELGDGKITGTVSFTTE